MCVINSKPLTFSLLIYRLLNHLATYTTLWPFPVLLVACQWVCFVSNSYKGGVVNSRRVVACQWVCFVSNSYKGGVVNSRRVVACQWVCFVSNSYKGGVVNSRRVVSNSWLGFLGCV
jgi:hypothetical protein